jgi:hypothetical protein
MPGDKARGNGVRVMQTRCLERFTNELRTTGLAGVIVAFRSAKGRPFAERKATLRVRFDVRHSSINRSKERAGNNFPVHTD